MIDQAFRKVKSLVKLSALADIHPRCRRNAHTRKSKDANNDQSIVSAAVDNSRNFIRSTRTFDFNVLPLFGFGRRNGICRVHESKWQLYFRQGLGSDRQ